jgi:hypothetical protein
LTFHLTLPLVTAVIADGHLDGNGPPIGSLIRPHHGRIVSGMKKRIAAAILWFYAGWFVGAFVAFALALSPALAPIMAVAAAGFMAGDPARIIWSRPRVARQVPTGALQNPA